MDIQQIVSEEIKNANPDVALNTAADYDVKLKDMGFDSIQFLGIVIGVCEKLGIDMTQVNSMQVSTENTANEFIDNFKAYVPSAVTA